MDVIKKPIRLVVNEKSGFRNSNGTPIIIYDPRGMMFYDTRENDHTVWQFNLPAGEYFIDPKSKIVKMSNPVEYDLLPLPPIERTKRGNPELFDVVFGNNPYKATVFWDHRAMLFDNSLKDISLPALVTIFQHECGHKYYKTESYCDKYAYNEMIKAGYNPSQIGFAFVNTLSEKQLPRKNELVHSMLEGNTNYDCYDRIEIDEEIDSLEKAEVEKFFIGDRKFTVSGIPVKVWDTAGGKIVLREVKPYDTIGKIEALNTAGTWGYLRKDQYNPKGGAVFLNNSMSTVLLNTEAPKSTGDAIRREVPNAVSFVGDMLGQYKWLIIIALLILLAPYVVPAIKSFKPAT